jgi:hypothetical protein
VNFERKPAAAVVVRQIFKQQEAWEYLAVSFIHALTGGCWRSFAACGALFSDAFKVEIQVFFEFSLVAIGLSMTQLSILRSG